MNPVQKILLEFAINEAKKNPAFLANLVEHLLEKLKVDPVIAKDISDVVTELIPLLLADVKV